jgi:capsular polysaccharide biosynthesis protein
MGDGKSLAAAALVGLLCLLAAAVYLAVLVWADQTARDAKELERRLKVPVLTTIPLIGLNERF